MPSSWLIKSLEMISRFDNSYINCFTFGSETYPISILLISPSKFLTIHELSAIFAIERLQRVLERTWNVLLR